jgi:hypothetical protein
MRSHAVIRRNGQRTGQCAQAIAPTASEPAVVARVTWFAVIPTQASRLTCGRKSDWKAGFRS